MSARKSKLDKGVESVDVMSTETIAIDTVS